MRILVVGDAMLDLYWFGDVSRISPEAPVPVVRMVRSEERAGAAANVARNCRAMGAEVTLIAPCGVDDRGRQLREMVAADGIDFIGCPTSVTTQKLRVIGRSQQMVRVDIDPPVDPAALDVMSNAFVDNLEDADMVVFSDYGKGALARMGEMIFNAKGLGKTVLVDPKGFDYEPYAGADLVKPNLDEMRELVGGWRSEDELNAKALKLMRGAGIGAVLLTRAADGMTLFTEQASTHIKADAREVFDVSGAGDTAIAALAVAAARGYRLEEACRFANRAAGIVVGRFGTAVANEGEVFGLEALSV